MLSRAGHRHPGAVHELFVKTFPPFGPNHHVHPEHEGGCVVGEAVVLVAQLHVVLDVLLGLYVVVLVHFNGEGGVKLPGTHEVRVQSPTVFPQKRG